MKEGWCEKCWLWPVCLNSSPAKENLPPLLQQQSEHHLLESAALGMLVSKAVLVTMQLSPSAELFLSLGFHFECLLWSAMV